ncbi:MAG: group III truncated hemoglobin [Bacteroidota bacterium]|nr:group III truncated hemoglobin [Bacteroidota bacterium]
MEDVKDLSSIIILVDDFYGKVHSDKLLGPVFSVVIKDDWQSHLDKMYAFWNAALFGGPGFNGNPFTTHATLPIAGSHFQRWIKLFAQTIDEHFEGPKASETKTKAGLMSLMFQSKLSATKDGSKVLF